MPSAIPQKHRTLNHLHRAEREALRELKRALRREFGRELLELSLFGSRARGEGCAWSRCRRHGMGDADRLSDLDVVLLLRDASFDLHLRAQDCVDPLELRYDVCIDMKIFSLEEWQEGLDRELLFYREAERDRVEI